MDPRKTQSSDVRCACQFISNKEKWSKVLPSADPDDDAPPHVAAAALELQLVGGAVHVVEDHGPGPAVLAAHLLHPPAVALGQEAALHDQEGLVQLALGAGQK